MAHSLGDSKVQPLSEQEQQGLGACHEGAGVPAWAPHSPSSGPRHAPSAPAWPPKAFPGRISSLAGGNRDLTAAGPTPAPRRGGSTAGTQEAVGLGVGGQTGGEWTRRANRVGDTSEASGGHTSPGADASVLPRPQSRVAAAVAGLP